MSRWALAGNLLPEPSASARKHVPGDAIADHKPALKCLEKSGVNPEQRGSARPESRASTGCIPARADAWHIAEELGRAGQCVPCQITPSE